MAKSPPTPTEFSAETEEALLGEAWHRKNRGRSEQIQGGEVAIVVDCAGNDELATQITITCEVVPVVALEVHEMPPGTLITPPIIGVIEWGNDGSTVTAEFDFVNGTVLSVAAASVRVKAAYEVPPAQPFPVIVRGHVGYMPKPATPAQRTFRATLPNGNQVSFPVPKFARRVRLVRSPGGAMDLALFEPFGPSAIAFVSSADPILELPIPNDARAVVISNLGPVPVNVRVIFDLWI